MGPAEPGQLQSVQGGSSYPRPHPLGAALEGTNPNGSAPLCNRSWRGEDAPAAQSPHCRSKWRQVQGPGPRGPAHLVQDAVLRPGDGRVEGVDPGFLLFRTHSQEDQIWGLQARELSSAPLLRLQRCFHALPAPRKRTRSRPGWEAQGRSDPCMRAPGQSRARLLPAPSSAPQVPSPWLQLLLPPPWLPTQSLGSGPIRR